MLNSAPTSILVITLRFLGDTLLTTALLNSVRKAYPDAQLDVLTYASNKAILSGNPAISNIITTVQKPSRVDYQQLLRQIFLKYSLSINTQASDRATLYTVLSSTNRIGFVPKKGETGWLKRYLYTRWLEFELESTHTVLELLKLCKLLTIPACYELTAPSNANSQKILVKLPLKQKYVVLHIVPQWQYKYWTVSGWVTVANYLAEQGFQIILSGSPAVHEIDYLTKLQLQMPDNTLNLAGKLTLSTLADLIRQAQLFIGVDTGITHMAAATGTITLAVFGPSDPVKWSPWPKNYYSEKAPFKSKGNQNISNVSLIQAQAECVPCYLEGCERHQNSYSACLDALMPATVIAVIAQRLQAIPPNVE